MAKMHYTMEVVVNVVIEDQGEPGEILRELAKDLAISTIENAGGMEVEEVSIIRRYKEE